MAEKQEYKRMAIYATKQLPSDYHKLEEIKDQEVLINGGRTGKGKFGDFAVIEVVLESGEVQEFMTSGFLVIDAIQNAAAADAFPLAAKFTRTGRVWRIE